MLNAPDLLELLLGIWRRVLVRMVLDRCFAVCLLEVEFVNIGPYAQL